MPTLLSILFFADRIYLSFYSTYKMFSPYLTISFWFHFLGTVLESMEIKSAIEKKLTGKTESHLSVGKMLLISISLLLPTRGYT